MQKQDAYNNLAKILRTDPKILLSVDQRMSMLTGQDGVLEAVSEQNRILVDRVLSEFGLTRESTAMEVYGSLLDRLVHLDGHIRQLLDNPDLSTLSASCGKLCDTAFRVFTPPRGFFIKRERAVALLNKYPPSNMLEAFKGCCSSIEKLVEHHGFASVVSALRFMESKEWMHKFFDEAYTELTPDDFEEREVELKVLDTAFMSMAGEAFVAKKHHNISHLKEYGVIFIVPIPLNIAGETIRMFTLILHYLHEVPFYAHLIRSFMHDKDFTVKLKSLLRGDVPKGPTPEGEMNWRIVQQYLAKDDENDFRLFEPHVNPEAIHWLRAEEDLGRLNRMLNLENGRLNLGYWTGLDFVGDYFKDAGGQEVLVSFDLIDLIMSLVKKGQSKYLYHQQEALWNKIFMEYMGRERLDQLINENIIKGFIEL